MTVTRDSKGYINIFGTAKDSFVYTATEKGNYSPLKLGDLKDVVQVTSVFYAPFGISIVALDSKNNLHHTYQSENGWMPWLFWNDWNDKIKAVYIKLGNIITSDNQGGYGLVVKTPKNQVLFSWMSIQHAFAPWTTFNAAYGFQDISISFGTEQQIIVGTSLSKYNNCNSTIFTINKVAPYPPPKPGPDYPPTYCWPDENLDPLCGTAL
jgi:hypothetical protein